MDMHFVSVILSVFYLICRGSAGRSWVTVDDLENHVRIEDLREFLNMYNKTEITTPREDQDYAAVEDSTTALPVPNNVDCFGLGTISRQIQAIFNMRPDTSDDVNTHFYFSSRKRPLKVQVYPGEQFGLQWVDFDPKRRTVMIYHGFMSHSNASWVLDMTAAFLQREDVNVIAVDWSKGGDTWKYWRAVANTRRVGSDVTRFMRQLIAATGARIKDFHFIGHSLGAHIASYVSYHIGGVSRITGLDPAQPCFLTTDDTERLDSTDADFVDVIHTNGRLLKKIGFGLPDPAGHADFYPNGGMKQPGCSNETNSVWSRLTPSFFSTDGTSVGMWYASSIYMNNVIVMAHHERDAALFVVIPEDQGVMPLYPDISLPLPKLLQPKHQKSCLLFKIGLKQAICSHGRAYLLFTESLINGNCTFRAHRWNLTYEGVNASLKALCDKQGSCAEMGIMAAGGDQGLPRAKGPYFVLTTDKEPYCPTDWEVRHPPVELLRDLRQGFSIDRSRRVEATVTPGYADPEGRDVDNELPTTTCKSWFQRWFG